MIDLNKLALLAEGAQAQVYHYGDDKVLRVMRSTGGEALLKHQIAVSGVLRDAGVPVPKVYEYVKVERRPAVVMEKIKGNI